MTTIGHKVGIPMQRAGENTYHDIVVGDGVWIGANVTILQGVTIGSGSIIAAGSLVRSDVKPNTLVVGVPAKEIKSI